MKLKKTLMVLGMSAVLGTPLMAGEAKSFKEKVIVEVEETKWWNAAASTGWDSLYMFRGVNVLRDGQKYGSGLYWIDVNATWNITDNDFLNAGAWMAFGTSTYYQELDAYITYTHTFGDLAVSLGYIYYDVFSGPLYSHELNTKVAYTFNLPKGITITPSLTYYFNLGPDVDEEGIAPNASSYLNARIDAGIPLYKDILSATPWIAMGTNFEYNSKVESDGTTNFFNGVNNLEMGIGFPIKVTDMITLYGYGAYSYQYYGLVGTEPSTFWGGAKVTFSF